MKSKIYTMRHLPADYSVADSHQDLLRSLQDAVKGQPRALDAIEPVVRTHLAGLSPSNRPAGVFLLLGPTGTGKTHTVEAVAEALHGSRKNLLRIDCGEYQMDHEVAKLIGAPPGYLGHRETQAALSQSRLTAVTSNRSNLSVVLLDEVEKAAPSMTRLLLGVLDKATLRLGDNSLVDFENSLIFMTSNVGAREMAKASKVDFGFARDVSLDVRSMQERIAMRALKRRFAPEFLNRVDSMINYDPLTREVAAKILDLQIAELQRHLMQRLQPDRPQLLVSEAARAFLLEDGFSPEYGARELRRSVQKHVLQPLARLLAEGRIGRSGRIKVDYGETGFRITHSRRVA